MLIFWAVLGGFLLDALFGDPAWLPHPVVLMGRCISALEKHLRTALPKTPRGELVGGAAVAAVLPLGTLSSTNTTLISSSPDARIIPLLSTPRSLTGFRLVTTTTCLPTNSSGA